MARPTTQSFFPGQTVLAEIVRNARLTTFPVGTQRGSSGLARRRNDQARLARTRTIGTNPAASAIRKAQLIETEELRSMGGATDSIKRIYMKI